ncbi:glycosyltransferase family 2 protein [Floccifex sp.]|uniref:glycosyltransferase family 2 protein n=1 Tax=Floccifex sp. TaxID=2815810 RepID=UPI003EFD3E4A
MIKGLISIIVPIYKVENTLDRCVKSIMNQTYHDLEIILVNDGSPDKCPIMCNKYAEKDKRIKVIHKNNGGLSEARNFGLNAANGEFVMYVDSDDYIEIDACKRLLQGMQFDVDFVVGAIKEIREDRILYQKHTNIIPNKVYSSRDFVIRSIEKNEWYAPAVLNLYRRDFLLKNQLFFKVGYYFEDMEMLLRLFLASNRVLYVDYPFYNYVIRSNSIMTSNNSDKKVKMIIDIYKEWYQIISNIKDKEYQKYLYGVLTKYYISASRRFKICGWKIEEINFMFSWKYALNMKERLKVVLFNYFPKLYLKI